jgi:hypothetical protein
MPGMRQGTRQSVPWALGPGCPIGISGRPWKRVIPSRTGIYVGEGDGANKRRHGRVRVQGVTTNLGDVIEISASGMSLERRWKAPVTPGEVVNILLSSEYGCLVLPSRGVWTDKLGMVTHRSGVLFLDLAGERRAALIELVRVSIDPAVLSEIQRSA